LLFFDLLFFDLLFIDLLFIDLLFIDLLFMDACSLRVQFFGQSPSVRHRRLACPSDDLGDGISGLVQPRGQVRSQTSGAND